jgi:hypothetical protein
VRAASVYTSESGEWKLGGFDILSSMKEDDAIIYVSVSMEDRQNKEDTNLDPDIRQSRPRFTSVYTTGNCQGRMGHYQKAPFVSG